MARPKRWIGIDREARSNKLAGVKTSLPSGTTRSNRDSSSISTSSRDASGDDSASIEMYELAGHRESSWLEAGAMQTSPGDDTNEALSRETTLPPDNPQESEEDCVILESVAASETEHLAKSTRSDALRGLHDGREESTRSFKCTTCGLKFFSARNIQEHPHLRVGFCRSCRNFLFSSPYTKSSEDGSEEQCRWCGEGGKIVMCDDCDKVFCEACITRNFGPKSLAEIVNSEHWSCFSCKPECLRPHITEFQKFIKSAIPAKRRVDSPLEKSHPTRNATNFPAGSADAGGETIAELLAQEEERRRQNPGQWNKSKPTPARKPSRGTGLKEPAGRRNRAASTTFQLDHASFPKQTGPRTSTIRHEMRPDATVADIVQLAAAAAAPSTPATKTYIRPHQWLQRRQEAAERRKRAEEAAAEATRSKNVATNYQPNDGQTLKNKVTHNNSNTHPTVADSRVICRDSHSNEDKQAPQLRHRPDQDHSADHKLHNYDNIGMTQVKWEHLPDSADVADHHGNLEGNLVEKTQTQFFAEGSTSQDWMQTSDHQDAFGNTVKNLFANFAQ